MKRFKVSKNLTAPAARGLAAIVLIASPVFAQTAWPTKPVKIVVPFAPGGGADAAARAIADGLQAEMGVPFVIDNKGGAKGILGATEVAKSKPDGYTLLLGNMGLMAITATLEKQARFDPIKDYAPVSQLTSTATVLVVNSDLQANSLKEFVDLAKTQPGKLNFGSSSASTSLPMVLFSGMAGISLNLVPYKGGAPALTDLVGGHIQAMFAGAVPAAPHIKSARVRALATSGSKRSRAFPDIPTVAESGYPEFSADSWSGLFAPAGTSQAVIDKLNAAVQKAAADPKYIGRLAADGTEAVASTPAKLGGLLEQDFKKWKTVIETSGINFAD